MAVQDGSCQSVLGRRELWRHQGAPEQQFRSPTFARHCRAKSPRVPMYQGGPALGPGGAPRRNSHALLLASSCGTTSGGAGGSCFCHGSLVRRPNQRRGLRIARASTISTTSSRGWLFSPTHEIEGAHPFSPLITPPDLRMAILSHLSHRRFRESWQPLRLRRKRRKARRSGNGSHQSGGARAEPPSSRYF